MPNVPECLPIDHGGPVNWPFEPFRYSALEGSVTDRFEEIASRFASRLAIQDCNTSMTYGELAALVGCVASALIGLRLRRDRPVGIWLPADGYFPAAMLGVLKAGMAYVPLDVDNPIERNRLIAAHAQVCAVISAADLAGDIEILFPPNVPILDIKAIMPAAPPEPNRPPGPDDFAYIIYTSGSTGTPKGVFQSHRNLLHDVLQYTNALHLNCDDRLSMLYSPSVAGANRDIYGALLNGASLHILPPRNFRPADIVREFCARKLTIYHSVPALFRHITRTLGADHQLESVRIAYLAGDRVDWSDVDAFRSSFSSHALLYVAMGSTECAVAHSHWFVDDKLRAKGIRLPVGRPVPDRKVTIVDRNGNPVPNGDPGELVVTSRYIALGYWRDPELTAAAFAADQIDPRIRTFKTGDIVRLRPDGLFEFMGRKDRQVKLRGHRIELGEIESALRTLTGVGDAAVVVRRSGTGLPQLLVAYVEPRPGGKGLLPLDLASRLARRLPRYMTPATVNVLDRLPRLPNFKIDRTRLAQMDAAWATRMAHPIDDPVVHEAARIFDFVIGTVGATPEDNVASLGGDSLQSVMIALELENRFGISIPVEIFEGAQTIRDLGRWIASQKASHRPGAKLD